MKDAFAVVVLWGVVCFVVLLGVLVTILAAPYFIFHWAMKRVDPPSYRDTL